MNNINEVKINEYRNKLREIIEELESVSQCFIYSGEFNTEDEKNIKINLNLPKSTCFIDVTIGQFIKNPVIKGIDVNCNFVIYIAAKNDFNNVKNELRSQSEVCMTTIYEIIKELYENKLNTDVIGYPEFLGFRQITSGERNKTRYSVFALEFSQSLNFFKKNK